MPSGLILRLLVVFTQQLEILVTTLAYDIRWRCNNGPFYNSFNIWLL